MFQNSENNNWEIIKDMVKSDEEETLLHILFIGLHYKDFQEETNTFLDPVLTEPRFESEQHELSN